MTTILRASYRFLIRAPFTPSLPRAKHPVGSCYVPMQLKRRALQGAIYTGSRLQRFGVFFTVPSPKKVDTRFARTKVLRNPCMMTFPNPNH